MAITRPIPEIEAIHGKLSGDSKGYFYVVKSGKQCYRNREETYQRNQSPRQRWNSAAFAFAHSELRRIESDPQLTDRMNAEYEAANHLAPNGRTYLTAHAWQFNTFIHNYKSSHPLTDLWKF